MKFVLISMGLLALTQASAVATSGSFLAAETDTVDQPVVADTTPTEPTTPTHKVPFQENPWLEGFGIVLMAFLIALSNAGGLSGAGTNIPIMLIFFGMEMDEAVPISGFVAVTATVFRFILNFNQNHPKNPERSSINYEVVMITMPAVFLGSFIGVTASHKWVDPVF